MEILSQWIFIQAILDMTCVFVCLGALVSLVLYQTTGTNDVNNFLVLGK